MRVGPLNRPLVRLALYGLIFGGVLLWKSPWRDPATRTPIFPLSSRDDTTTTVTLSGGDLAPQLLTRLASLFHEEYPVHDVVILPGGGAFGLQALARGQATVTALYRPPSLREQEILQKAIQDTVAWFPVAFGGMLLLCRDDSSVDSLSMQDLRDLIEGADRGSEIRIYAPDPNQGLWGAFLKALGLPDSDTPSSVVTFVRDGSEVRQAVAADPNIIGLASSLAFPAMIDDSVHVIPVRADTAAAAVLPTYEAIGYGEYPLYHHLYVACQPYRTVAAAKFVTYLTSDRGQRAIERTGYLPARLPSWEIQLTRKPVGS